MKRNNIDLVFTNKININELKLIISFDIFII